MTNDVTAVKKFYGELFGWKYIGTDDPQAKYTTITQNGRPMPRTIYNNIPFDTEIRYVHDRIVPEIKSGGK